MTFLNKLGYRRGIASIPEQLSAKRVESEISPRMLQAGYNASLAVINQHTVDLLGLPVLYQALEAGYRAMLKVRDETIGQG